MFKLALALVALASGSSESVLTAAGLAAEKEWGLNYPP
jgi:hypothetical protein